MKTIKNMKKNDKRLLLAYIIVFSFLSVYFIGSYTGAWMLYAGNGGSPPDGSPGPGSSIPKATTLFSIYPTIDTDGSVTINWVNVSDATSYKLYRSKDGGTYVLVDSAITSTSYTDSGLIDGQYSYKIISTNVNGNSGDSNIRSVTVQLSADEVTIETDYTLTYILIGVFIFLVMIVTVFIWIKKRRGVSVSKKI